ncbi:MAG: tyrosine-type recombinase/integrase [Candidatus Nanopelagicales bacterium]
MANDESRILTPAQLKAVLKKLEAHRLFALFHLAAFTGMRRGECVGLRWRDVDLEASEVTVRVNVTRGGWRAVTTPPRSLASLASLPLTPARSRR